MFRVNRKFAFVVALAAALVMLFMMSSIAFAGDDTTKTICVDGYVINHRELAVDGTKTEPPLIVEAVSANGKYTAEVGSNGYFKFKEPFRRRLGLPYAVARWLGRHCARG